MNPEPTAEEAAKIILAILKSQAPLGGRRGVGAVKYEYDLRMDGAEGFVQGLKEGERRGWFESTGDNGIIRRA
jgi:hypothetical protein